MMKKILLTLIVLLLGGSAWSQNHQYVPDSAALVVDGYLKLLNFKAVKPDSMLYIESYIYNRSYPEDTIVMKRWHVEPYYNRVEVWHKDTLQDALHGNAKDVFRWYNQEKKAWQDLSLAGYYDHLYAYDYRGPLNEWRTDGSELFYQGVWNYNHHEAYRIFVKSPSRYDRYYLFEKETGLLFLIDEQEGHNPDMDTHNDTRVDWRAIHEYTPLDLVVFPTIESYQKDNEITLIFHKMKYIPIDMSLFINDKR
ncbi:MAG: hypothetical protein K5864_02450 [Bacteroidales bacterium]|nr:hypothetical protein [Bacteroidales bacterium]